MEGAHIHTPTPHYRVEKPVLRTVVGSCLGKRFARFVKPAGRQRRIHRATRAAAIRRLDPVIILSRIHQVCQKQLLLVVEAFAAQRRLFRPGQGRQKHAGQNADDGNHHQQLNQGECVTNKLRVPPPMSGLARCHSLLLCSRVRLQRLGLPGETVNQETRKPAQIGFQETDRNR